MTNDPTKIPPGEDCYRLYPIREGEVLSNNSEEYGNNLREFSFLGNYKQVLCPYWEKTDYGTVKCLFLNQEYFDENSENSFSLLSAKIGEELAENFPRDNDLIEEIKICGINNDQEDPKAYDA